jgi:hypothetical protein
MKFLVCVNLFLSFFLFSRAQEIISLGKTDSEGELVSPRQIEEGPDGNIYVSDSYDFFIKVYSPSGNFIRQIAGKGEGPGEMKRIGCFGFSPSGRQLFFTEGFNGHRWITVMNPAGDFIKVFKLQLTGIYGISKTVMLSDGRFISEIHSMNEDSIEKNSDYFTYKYPISLVLLNNSGQIKNQIAHQHLISSISIINSGADISIPFKPPFLWNLTNGSILIANAIDSSLMTYDIQGRKTGEIKLQIPQAVDVQKIDIDNWRKRVKLQYKYRDREWFNKFGKVVDDYNKSIYDKKPVFDNFSVTPDGQILLTKNETLDKSMTKGWILNTEGKILLMFNIKCSGLILSKNYLFFRKSDRDENIFIGLIKRSGTEPDDIQKLSEILNHH